MSNEPQKKQSRRVFFESGARYACVAAMAVFSVGAIFKRRKLVKENKCINGGICCNCAAFTKCVLPQALSAKQSSSGGKITGAKGNG